MRSVAWTADAPAGGTQPDHVIPLTRPHFSGRSGVDAIGVIRSVVRKL